MIVLDASAVVELLFNTVRGRGVHGRIADLELSLHAPALLDVEVAQVVRRYVQLGKMESSRGLQALAQLEQLDVERYLHESLLSRIWQLRHNFTAYDAAYVALAEVLGATLLTADSGMATATTRWVRVERVV